jgi:glycogen debranching enzyme
MSDPPRDDLVVGDRYYILASGVAADLPRLVLKHDDAFLVVDRRGDLPALPETEFGLYVDGTRFLHQLDLRLHDRRPLLLNATVSEDAVECAIELTNPDIVGVERIVHPAGSEHIDLPSRALRVSRLLTLYANRLYQTVTIESFAPVTHQLDLTWRFASDFADVFEVRGYQRRRRGRVLPEHGSEMSWELGYLGIDDVTRTTRLEFDPAPARLQGGAALYTLTIPPGGRVEMTVTVTAVTNGAPGSPGVSRSDAVMQRRREVARLRNDAATVSTDHQVFNSWCERARRDLHLLLTETPDGVIPYAGIPWYVAPFGRDSLITALQVLPFEPEVARGTLRLLGRYQATIDDAFTDQEPGKIFHEYRRGELAACREIPFVPYYGTVDATPLFIMLLAEHLRWTGDIDLARELWPAAERALAWMTAPGRGDRPGYLVYERRSPVGLEHQGWKDSHDAIMHASGELAPPPIALIEAQGYAYAAWLSAAELAVALGRGDLAPAYRERAERLRERVETDFWMADEEFYALALDGRGRPCRVISSNPGHALWTRIVSRGRAEAVSQRVMAEDMYTGWGLRTLSAGERLYNPMSYHNGSVWPHDTAIVAVGMLRYGLVEPFMALMTGLFQAVHHFEGFRMPELFCGFSRVSGHGPTRYPVACSPQAWSAGVVFQLVAAMLGLAPDAAEKRLTLDRPRLPPWLSWLEIRGLRLAKARLDLRVSQGQEGAAVELLAREGHAEVVVRG